jgi:excisionase family DNA binding protein
MTGRRTDTMPHQAPAEFKEAIEAAALAPMRLLYSPNRAAELLDVSRSSVYTLMKTGALRYVMIGSDRRIPHSELERLAREGTGTAEEGGG